ncbi:MAG: Excinuclease ABC subunit A [Candidatus Tokpelaia sp. JSC188]|nr:MAG: Excinuclease ABC subunit A [Candidatus Tokpelaia sp. JSC188]
MENYLKSIDPNLPRDNLIVISSISGFESRFLYLIYIKYRRRKGFAIENLSTYVRRLFENNEATDGDRVYSLSLVISIKKETSSKIHIQVLRWLRKFRKYRYDINAR